jgi:hypothetical protein
VPVGTPAAASRSCVVPDVLAVVLRGLWHPTTDGAVAARSWAQVAAPWDRPVDCPGRLPHPMAPARNLTSTPLTPSAPRVPAGFLAT